MAKYLTDLADVLRKAGLEVVEMPGWKTRGRPGDFNPTRVLCHHTAGPGDGYNDAWYMAAVGRADLSAPLSQLALSRKGVWYVLAAGRANHAGRCKAIGGLKPYSGESYGDGNAQMLGVEAQNRGTDAEDWTPTQYGAYVRGVAALTRHYGWAPPYGHKETSTSGKVDPDFSMSTFRADVAATNPSTAAQEDDVTPEDIKAIADEVLKRPVYEADGTERTVGWAIGVTLRNSARAATDATVARNLAEAAALKGAALTADEVKGAVKAALSETVELDIAVKAVQ